jgi:deoxyribodipyrimidine photo-lyase
MQWSDPPNMTYPTLLWFKRDLRATDHPALGVAAARGAVLPLYIVEPEYWQTPETSARQWAFTMECVAELRRDLAALGQPLVVRVGDALTVLESLRNTHAFTHIVSHVETGGAWCEARDARVAEWATAVGVCWSVVDPALVADAPDALPPVRLEPGPIPSARNPALTEDRCPHRQIGGRSQGLALLGSFLTSRGASYPKSSANALIAERSCSRLSPYLALGAVSRREITLAIADRRAEVRGQTVWTGVLRNFDKRIQLRGDIVQLLEGAETPADAADNDSHLEAWDSGTTGLPFVDATMRYLTATGWVNHPSRAMLMSVACCHLGLDWRVAGQHLARKFTDYDPAIHWTECEKLAGIEGVRIARQFHPVKQALMQDPTGAFTRRWVPELAKVPDRVLQEPWKWTGAQTLLGRRYPEPIVNLANAMKPAARSGFVPQTRVGRAGFGAAGVRPAPTVRRKTRASAPGQLLLDL